MDDVRCPDCAALLFKLDGDHLEIKCPKCGAIIRIRLQPAPDGGLTGSILPETE